MIPIPARSRDAQEFTYLGDASSDRPARPRWPRRELDAFHDYQYLRDNPAGLHRELWFHEQGDRSWLVVTRDTATHEITSGRIGARCRPRGGRGA